VRPLLRPGAVAVIATLAITAAFVGLVQAAPAGASVALPGVTAARAIPPASPRAAPAGVTAAAADLVDTTTGVRLWSRLLNHRRPIASLTKVMTALVVIRTGHLDREIRVSASAVAYAREHNAGSAGLHVGDVLTTRQLLEGLLLPSGADAAYALAAAYGPGWRAFVAKMNDTARLLRMTDTHFANFDGLPWPTEWSTYATPRALLVLAQAAMQSATFRAIVSQRRHFLAPTRLHHGYAWRTTNLLLGRYPGAVGIKTGFTAGAGYCLLFAARRAGQLLAGVVLDSSTIYPGVRFTAAARMLGWGFSQVRHSGPG
jgi:serine-type D-Ala-D-Ala carboxypeptidase (penicillin-binding protein 5/6)